MIVWLKDIQLYHWLYLSSTQETAQEYNGIAQLNEKQKQWLCQTGGVCGKESEFKNLELFV